jgi:hypothetical protein
MHTPISVVLFLENGGKIFTSFHWHRRRVCYKKLKALQNQDKKNKNLLSQHKTFPPSSLLLLPPFYSDKSYSNEDRKGERTRCCWKHTYFFSPKAPMNSWKEHEKRCHDFAMTRGASPQQFKFIRRTGKWNKVSSCLWNLLAKWENTAIRPSTTNSKLYFGWWVTHTYIGIVLNTCQFLYQILGYILTNRGRGDSSVFNN